MATGLHIAQKAKSALAALLSGDPDVVGIGITGIRAIAGMGRGVRPEDGCGFAVKVNLTQRLPATKTKGRRPRKIEGVPVKYEVVGEVQKR